MLTSRMFRSWLRPQSTRKPRRPLSRIPRADLRLVTLEERAVPATITVTGNGDLVSVDSLVTLREAIEAISLGADTGDVVATGPAYGTNDTILFQVGLTSPISTNAEMTITKALTITGPGSGLLSVTNIGGASTTSRIFTNSNATGLVTITGLTLSGGNVLDADGGAILITAAGNMTLDGVVLTGNLAASATANQSDGGAISNNSTGTLTLNNCTVSNNSTTGSNDGGGINNETTGALVLTNCTFSGNTAGTGTTGDGGAIYTNASSPVTISNCTFSSNTAMSRGGGLYFTGPAAGSTISNSTVTMNKTTGGTGTGGGIFFSSSANVTLTSVTISNNSAAVASGGGIGSSGTVTLNTCVVSGNTSTTTGGGISSTGGVLTINNSSITGNSAKTTGGGLNNTTGTMNINSSTIDGNIATTSGGGINASSGTITLNAPAGSPGSTISNNSSVLGGGFHLSGGTVTIRNCTIAKNTATGTTGGGGLSVSGATVNLQNTTVALNAATGAGSTGGGFRRTSGTINLNSSIIANNTSLAGGADGHSTVAAGVTVTLNNSLIGSDVAGDNITYSGTGFTNVASGLDTGLALNGAVPGTPLTVALLSGSAINGGNNSLGLTTDARGSGFPRVQGSAADIGSFESPDPTPIASATSPDVSVGGGGSQTVTVVYTDINGSQLIDRTTIGVGNDITVNGPGGFTVNPTFVSADSAVDAKTITATYTFTAPDNTITDTWDFSDNGSYTITMNAAEVFDKDGTALSVLPGTIGSFAAKMPTTWKVDIAIDEDDGNTLPGDLSLREAIKLSNSAVGISDIIVFDAALNTVTLTFTLGEISISDPVTITGNGKTNTILSGATSRLFSTTITGAGGLVSMSGMKITGGTSAAIGGAFSIADDALTLTNVHLTGNKTTGVIDGGAIHTTTGTLKIIDSQADSNTSGDDGGVVYASSSATVEFTRSTLSGNTAAGRGGVVYMNSGGVLTVVDSTINNNVANTATTTAGGGGIHAWTAVTTITNSTISSNTATNGVGGGIRIASSGSLTINNSTITKNSAAALGGGGISITSASSVVSIKSTIVAQNLNATHPDYWSSVATTMNFTVDDSLFGAVTDADITYTGTFQGGSLATPIDALLAGLNNYGGPTQTHGLLPGSPALNMGSNGLTLSYDQRGSGFPRVDGVKTDVGAFEGQLKIPSASATLVDVTTAGGTTYVVTVTYSDESGIDDTTIGTADVTLTGPGYGSPESPISFTQSGPGLTNTATYTFNAPGGTFGGSDNGTYSLNLLGSQVYDIDTPTPNAAFAGVISTFKVNIPQVLLVDIVADEDDGNYNPGDLSLREAMKLSNASLGAHDTIQFDAPLTGQTLSLSLGELSVVDPFDLTGLGAANLTISGNLTNRMFNFAITGKGAKSTISAVTLSGGKVTGSGGAILLNDDELTLSNSVVTGNSVSSNGGGIQMTGGTLKINSSTVSNNTSGSTGGGIHTSTAAAVIEITNSTVTGNSGTTGGGLYMTSAALTVTGSTFSNNLGSAGAGLSASTGSVVVISSTFSGNVSSGTGGGIRLSSTGTLNVTNSTISGNTGTTGGGIYTASGSTTITYSTLSNNVATSTTGGGGFNISTGKVTITNATFSGNSATNASGIGGAIRGSSSGTLDISNSTFTKNSAGGAGGGAFGFSGTTGATIPTVNMSSTIVAQNINTLHPDLYTAATTVTLTATINDSIIGADAGLVLISGANNQTGSVATPLDALLSPLGNYGGPTQTHGLGIGSPALDKGTNLLVLTNDQRGAGFTRTLNAITDVGAFEGLNPVPIASATAPNVTAAGGTSHTITVIYTDDVGIVTGSLGATGGEDIEVSGPGYAIPVVGTFTGFTGAGQSITATYTIPAPGGTFDKFDSGKYTITMLAGGVTDGTYTVPAGPIGSFKVAISGGYVVDTIADEDDTDYSPGDLSLREAVRLSNNSENATDTITFDAALNTQTITLTLGELKTTDGVTITGPGSGLLTINGNAASRIFDINNNAAGAAVYSISGLMLTNGKVTGDGGAIFIQDENVTLTDLNITGNSATVDGGGINLEVDGGSLTLLNSSVSNNAAGTSGDADGGGINIEGASTTTIKNSTIANNTTFDDGGGILFQKRAAGHTVLIENTTVSGNTSNAATGGGGGFNFGGTFLSLVVRNSTVSGNFTKKDGGGMQFYAVVDPVTIENTTIAFNSATGNGGGINQFTDATGTITMESTIVSDNVAAVGTDIQSTVGTVASAKNAIGSYSVTNFTDNGGNLIGQVLLLTPLASNGGPTQTIRPQSTSPVVGAGSNPAFLTTDQRGAGFPRQVGAAVDIGSFEVDPNIPTAVATLANVTTSGATSYSFTVTYTDDVSMDILTIKNGNDITVTGPSFGPVNAVFQSVDIDSDGTPRTATYAFTPPGGDWNDIDNGTYTVTLANNAVADKGGTPVPGGTLGTFKVAIPVTVVVDYLTDENDGIYTPGDLSLREAIGLSNASPTTINVITFAPGLFTGPPQTMLMTLGEMLISANVTITGPGANKLTIDGNNASRIFRIDDSTTTKIPVTISGMSLTKGQSSGSISSQTDGGGAIFINNEMVTLDSVEIHNNTAVSFGGAIFADSGTELVIHNSTLRHNTANGGDTTQGGGAIEIESNGGSTLRIRNSTLVFNRAGFSTSTSVGGAIILYSGVPNLILENTTITGNTAHQAGGIRSFSAATGSILVNSSIISGNTGLTSQPDLQTGTSTPWAINNSLIGSTVGVSGPAVLDAYSTANVGYAVLLGPVQNNGGPTSTMALLLTNTKGINEGTNPFGFSNDQRGPGFARVVGAAADIGAYEIQPPPSVSTVVPNGGGVQRSNVYSIVVTFSEAVTFSGPVVNAFTLTRANAPLTATEQPGVNGKVNIVATPATGPTNTVTLTFATTGVEPIFGVNNVYPTPPNSFVGYSLPDGTYNLAIDGSQITGGGGNMANYSQTGSSGSGDKLFRLFGDLNGDGAVSNSDFNAFKVAFASGVNVAFDYNNDGDVANNDFNQLKTRFGSSMP